MLPRIIVLAVAAAILLGVCFGGLIKMVAGPKKLDTAQTGLNGKYVSFDASEVIVAFANLTVTKDSSTETLETYYLLPAGENTYIAVVDYKDQNVSALERAMEQSHEYYMGDLESLTRIGTLQGTVKPLEEDMTSYMAECIDNYTLPGYEEGRDSSRLVIPYQVELNYAGFLSEKMVLILSVCALVVLILLVVQFILVFAGVYQRKVRGVLEEDAAAAFDSAEKIERVRVDTYVWYTEGPTTRAVKTEELVWGYMLPEPMVVSKYRWPVALYTADQKMLRINFMEQGNCKKFLSAIAGQGNPFVSGYTSELGQIFQSDFEKFMKLAEDSAKEQN